MLRLCLIAVAAAVALGCETTDPLGIREKLYWTSCNTADEIQTVSVTVTDANGNPNYPIDVSKPIVLKANSKDSSTNTYPSILIDVSVQVWSTFFGDCKWRTFPTFGLLDNIKGGALAPDQNGMVNIDQQVDLSKYAIIIDALVGKNPYLVQVRFKSSDNSKEMLCLEVGAMIAK